MKRNILGSEKVEYIVYVHSKLFLASHRSPEYNSGPYRDWCMDPKSPNIDISFAALNFEEHRNGIGNKFSTPQSTIKHAFCYIFQDRYEDEDDD